MLEQVIRGLLRVMKPDYVCTWLLTPNPAFEGRKPVELLENREYDRLLRMIYELESGGLF